MEFGENGNIVDYSISCTTLKRPIRLTYEEVEAILNESATEQTAKNKKKVFVSSSSSLSNESFPLHAISNLKLSTPLSIEPNASLLGFQGANASLPSTDSIFKRVTSPQLTREEVTSTLQSLYRLAKKRRAYRERKGSIDFSFSEARFHVQNGVVDGSIAMDDVSLKVSEARWRGNAQSEELVMEMMVAAGETIGLLGKEEVGDAISRWFDQNIPLPYRSHPFNMILPADQMQMRHIP